MITVKYEDNRWIVSSKKDGIMYVRDEKRDAVYSAATCAFRNNLPLTVYNANGTKGYNSSVGELLYPCKENDVILKITFDERPEIKEPIIEDIHVAIDGLSGWTVVGYKDLKEIIEKAEHEKRIIS